MVGIILAKLRVVSKYLYLLWLGAISICLGVGFGFMVLAVLGFEDVGGNIYTVLYKYSIVFAIFSILFIYVFDKIIMFIQENIINIRELKKIKFIHKVYALISGAGFISYLFIVPDIIRTISFWVLFIGTLVYGLKSKIQVEPNVPNLEEIQSND